MIQTYKTHLSKKLQLTSDVWLYTFALVEPKEISFIPGQYVILMVPQTDHSVIPALHQARGKLQLGIQNSGSQIESGMTYARRLYSIASPNTLVDEFELLVKLVPQGCASLYLQKIQIGDEATFQGPAGMFILRESPRDKIFMVAGTGYAPVRSMLLSISNIKDQISKTQIKNQNEPPNTYHLTPNYYLLIGFPYYKDVFLFDELKQLASSFVIPDLIRNQDKIDSRWSLPRTSIRGGNDGVNSFTFKICLSREENLEMIPEKDRKYFLLGRVTKGFERLIESRFNREKIENFDYYLCSGREIVEALKQYLYQKGAPKEQVYFEKF